MRSTILFYNDAPAFGGHELMSVRLAGEFAISCRVVYFHAHEKIRDHLPAAVESVLLPFASRTGPLAVLRNLNARDISWLKREFRSRAPDGVIVVQGAIDLSLRGVLAAHGLPVPAVSYLPLAFPFRTMGLRHGWFFDRYRTLFYRLFDGFITINAVQRDLIRSFARREATIAVIENSVDLAVMVDKPRRARAHEWRVGVVGRLEWRQKDLSLLLEIAAAVVRRRSDVRFVLLGDGPDRGRLERRLEETGLAEAFEVRGWVDARQDIYSGFDVLLMTSLFEGVPLVLIEALSQKKCVLARLAAGTRVFTDYLPDSFLFGDAAAAAEKLVSIEATVERFSAVAAGLQERVQWRHGSARFAAAAGELLAELTQHLFRGRA